MSKAISSNPVNQTMKLRRIFSILIFLGLSIRATAAGEIPVPYGEGNLKFTENLGQWNSAIRFKAELKGGAVFAEQGRMTFRFFDPDDWAWRFEHSKGASQNPAPSGIRSHSFYMSFTGSDPEVLPQGEYMLSAYSNYFTGNDSTHWATGVRSYKKITYQDLYPGINLDWFQSSTHLKYEYHLAAGANPALIKEHFEYTGKIKIESGRVHIKTTVNDVWIEQPLAWQLSPKGLLPVKCNFLLSGDTLSYVFPDGYNQSLPLIIDPTLTFSTYTGSTADNWGFTATYDQSGNLYAGGIAFATGYPVTPGSLMTSFQGGGGFYPCDVSITKYNSAGTAPVYSTYLGGSDNEIPESMIVNSNDELFVLGATASANFPTSTNAFDKNFNGGNTISLTAITFTGGSDIFIAHFNTMGSQLLASTYIGGGANDGLNQAAVLNHNYADHARGEIMLDASGNVYVASSTWSANFPTTTGAYKVNISGNQDACVFKMPPDLSTLSWSTFIGGSSADAAYSVKVDAAGTAYVAGGTQSNNFPTTTGVYHSNYNGGTADGFALKLSANGNSLLASTFIGTSQYDQTFFIELDDYNNIYLLGQTAGAYPVIGPVYSNPNSGQFISKLNNGLSTMIYSTVFGKGDGNPDIAPTAFLVDKCENVYMAGWGGTVNGTVGNTYNLPLTANAYQSSTDGSDFYFFVLSKDAKTLLYATYFGGGQSAEHVDGGTSRFDPDGIIYEAVCAGCGGYDDFPTTPSAWSSTNNSSNCNEGAIKFEFQLANAKANAYASPASVGCVPYTVNFSSNGSIAFDYYWDFGDGQTSILSNPQHIYTDTGTYQVMLVALDTIVCNSFDTTYLTVKVLQAPVVTAAALPIPPDGCAPLQVQFQNNSYPSTNYQWDFGDGAVSNQSNPTHTYLLPGNYSIRLIALDTSICLNHDTTLLAVTAFDHAIADFQLNPPYLKTGETVQMINLSQLSYAWSWDFGDGTTSQLENPDHAYANPGKYTICLKAKNQQTCDDSLCLDIEVYGEPKVYIPTAFSPNGDLLNDVYYIIASGFKGTELQIFNRWGELVFQSNDINMGWDGNYNGKAQELDVYMYIFTGTLPDGKQQIFKGNITLIR